jgi:alpha-beta hydrolase superfamily lysophospholipase
LSRFSPNTGALTLPATAISRDPAVVRAYESDPLVFRGAIPARTLVELLEAMATFPDAVSRLRMPVLVQHGTADRLVPLAATRPLYERLGNSKQRTLRVYEGLFHEAYNEPEREQVLADLEAWIEHHR